ncbi:MAG TPA: DNRLRE domain-containing protein [Polyangia bacterium]|nr:DNRLRE domain-containing protein [Polyangia bacterium]
MTRILSIAIAGILSSTGAAYATTATFHPTKDNTLCESSTGALSNALGDLYVGRTGQASGSKRRAVMHFDVSSIPSNATITSVTLTLYLDLVADGSDRTCTLHRLTDDWGEGTSFSSGGMCAASTTNDATWIHEFYSSTDWTSAGGDYSATASASASCGDTTGQTYTWGSTAQLVADVQAWVSGTESNDGWIMIGDESLGGTARRYSSREESSNQPLLTVTY